MTSDAPLLQLKNVTKKFGDFTAVHSVNLEIEKGELFASLAVQGAGKPLCFVCSQALKHLAQDRC